MVIEVGTSEFRQNIGDYLDRIIAGDRIVLTRKGRQIAAVVSPGSLDLMLAAEKRNRRSREVRTGDYVTFDQVRDGLGNSVS